MRSWGKFWIGARFRHTACAVLSASLWGCGGTAPHGDSPDEPRGHVGTLTAPFEDPHDPVDRPLPNDEVTGTDADGDHIRDDVEAYIDTTYGKEQQQWLAARQLARAFQHCLAHREDVIRAQTAANDMARGISCVNSVGLEGGKARKELLARTLDTMDRLHAYHDFNSQLSGLYLKLPSGHPCDSDRRRP